MNGRQPTVSSFEFRGIPRNITRCNDPVLPRSTNPGCDTPPWTRTPGGYLEGETIGTLTTFSEPVRISGTPALTLTMESGAVTATAWGYYYPARNNHTKLWIQYVVQADDYDTNGVSVGRTALAMQSGVIRSRATGNPAILTLPSALGDQPYQTVLRTPPAPARITNIGFRADTRPFANNTYERDETIYLGVLFDRPVNLAGSRPTLSLTIGANTRAATYSGIVSGGRLITFEYLVQAGDLDADGASLPANALNLNGGTITTRSNSLAANIASDAVSNDAGRKVNGGVDGPPKPTHLAIISSPVVGNTYGTGERIRARLHFHKRIAVSGSPQLALSLTSETVQMAKYGTLSATTIDFAYTVKTTDRDADGLSVAANALALNGGSIRSHSGASNASLNLGSKAITNAGDHRVDGRVRNVPSFGSAVVSDKSWRVNTAVSDTLPASQGGRGSVTYALSPALPSGMSFNTSTLRIYGTARAVTARTQYTLTARDAHGATARQRFYITITANPVPTFGSATISDKSWTANAAITGFTLPAATGGDGTLRYSLSPNLPGGVVRDSTTRQVSGTPTGALSRTQYTWTATDTEGDSASLTFRITVASAAVNDLTPAFGDASIADKTWMQRDAITPFTLPTATGGDGTLTYSLSPNLPGGVVKSAAHRVSGTPTASSARTRYTWTATDADGDAASLSFHISVTADLSPYFSELVGGKRWIVGSAIDAFTLPAAMGGNGALTYTLSPSLPRGVIRDSSTRRVTGTPTESKTRTEYTWTATDADGDAASLTFDIESDALPTFGAQTITDKTWTQRRRATQFTLPAATGGDGTLTYAISPSFPNGITRNRNDVVSGAPTGYQTATTYKWTATDADGDKAELTFTITIAQDLSPTFGAQSIGNKSWTQRQAIDAFNLPTATSGDGTLTYTIDPALPGGVVKNASHRVSGTPSGYQGATTYTWKVTDADGDFVSLTFTIAIAQDRAPTFGAQTIGNKTWTQRQAIDAFTLPTASGGDGTLTYSIDPALPSGVVKNAIHRVSGTPSGHQAATTYTWKVTDADGDAAQLTFTIAIAQDRAPTFGAQSIGNQSWTQRQAINAFTLPTASGGDGTLTYAISPALPNGVEKDANHRVTGTPSGHQAATTYTWKATDADGDFVSLTFTIAIAQDLAPTFGAQSIGNKSWTQRQAIDAFILPTASGGDGNLTYALSPSLPGGVVKNDSHRVSGTPSGHQAATTYTWKVTDADGDAAQLTFTIAIAQDLAPTFGAQRIGNKTWTQRQAINAFTLPTASGGDGTLTYAISPDLPNGVTKNASHRVSGTPSGHQTATTYTWKATDADGDFVSLTFTIAIAQDLAPTFGTQTISDKVWTQRQAINAFTLPTASGGDGALTYAISPALPGGVVKNASHRVSGTPSGHQTATTYMWKATDADGDATQLTFTIAIAQDLAPTFGAQTIGNKTWTQRQAINAFTLPTASGGDGALTYTIDPALPGGVVKNASHRVSGTPAVALASTEYTWTATDTDGDKANLTFTIAVDGIPTFGTQTISDKSWTQRQQIPVFNLPTASGGDGTLTYAISPALPSGVVKNASHRVSGMPSGHQTATTYTWKVTDADGDFVSLTFTIAIAQDLAPTFGSQTVGNQSWTQRQAISAFTLPTASGGDGSLTYSIDPALPGGVVKNASHRVSGTPSGHQTATTYTWKVTDADGDFVSLTFTIAIAQDLAPSFGVQTISNKTWTQRQAIPAFTLPTASGGDGTLTYALSPALPDGVTKNDSHRVSGTPSGHQTAKTYTWKVTDADGDFVSLTFTIAIAQDLAPTFGAQTIGNKSWTQRQAINAFTLPTASGGDGTLTYAISPDLPNGVTKNASHRVSGTPSGHQTSTTYTWKATDADGDATQLTFTITIAQDLAPTFGAQRIANQSWTQRQAINAFTLPTASGGDGTLTYALSPALPNGVDKDANHRVSGTPSGHQGATTYTWKATDADGDATQLTFTITIAEDLMPTFGAQTIGNKSWTQRQAINAFTLPTATGGDGTLTYAISPNLPNGVTKNNSHRVSGTPSGHQTATTYTWKATDADGDFVSLTFTIAIAQDLAPTFGVQTIGNKSWTQRQQINVFTLPTASGGDGNLTYALSPALPDGVTKNNSHRVSGTPSGHQTAKTYTWKVTDADGDAAQLTFTITIAQDLMPTFGAQTIGNKSWTQRQAINAFTLPTASGGDGNLTYAISPALPSGVVKNASHSVSGTPSGHQTATRYTWKVTDADGDATQLTFTIAIAQDLMPTFGSQSIGNKTWTQRQAIDAFTLPTASGGDGALTYAISPALPDGVEKGANHRVTGTPSGHQPSTTYTWKATDADGDFVSLTFTIAIAEDLAPSFGAQSIDNQSWTQRQAIDDFTLPTASGGDGTLTYALSPALPNGVTKNANHRVSGTPSGHQTATTYTWKVTDADGDAAQLTFTISIAQDLAPSFGAQRIGNKTWTQRQAITPFTLPTASGGDGSLTYALSPVLPGGVVKNNSHRVSGTPSVALASTEYTWKATDADGDEVELTFTISIDGIPTFGTQTISDKAWTQRRQITAFILPAASGGDGSVTYALSPSLPNGVVKNNSRRVSGTPTVALASTEYTWTATDTDGDKANLTFTIAVDGVPTFGASTIANQSWTQRQAISAFTLPTASGGDGSLTYAISPDLPDGVAKNNSHRVSGTPGGHQTAKTYTWKATDADGDAAQLTFTITIAEDLSPTFGASSIDDRSWEQYDQITAFTLPTATGGDGALTYSIDPALPGGVVKSASHEVTGTPTVGLASTEYTWTATDADGDNVSLTFNIAVDGVPRFSATIANMTWQHNARIESFTLPTATGGDAPLSYAIDPDLPDGVTKNASHEVSGAPTDVTDGGNFTWKVTDADGDYHELTFKITIAARLVLNREVDNQPTFGTQTIANRSWTQRRAITAFTLPTATDGDAPLTYAISPDLPNGVTKNASHEVSGTPTGHQTATTYTWKATDNDGDEAELTFTIEIDGIPTFGTQTISDKAWTQRQRITAFTLPTASGGDGSLTYSIDPALPSGVVKNASHEVSGTPTAALSSTEYTWTATDTDGDEASLTFDIAVDGIPTFGTQTVSNQSWTQRQAITAFTLPTATDGDAPLSYTISPDLPNGVTKNASHRVTGTPSGHQTATTYTWKVTDADGDFVSLSFTIAINGVPRFSSTISDKTWTQRQQIDAFNLPTATGGDGNLTYSIDPALPSGVVKNNSHQVSGTPSGHQTATTYTWKVTDADGDPAQLTFTIAIAEDLAPTFGASTIDDQSWKQYDEIAPFTLPTATGGDGTLTYAISPDLPNGITKDDNHRVTGTPSGHQDATTYTWKVTDADGDPAQLTFTIAINGVPTFGDAAVPNQYLTKDAEITSPVALPTASGGDGALIYALSPALPDGVVASSASPFAISGTPTSYMNKTQYTWKATDADGDYAELTFHMRVVERVVIPPYTPPPEGTVDPMVIPAPLTFSGAITDKAWTQYQAITPFTLPTVTGGRGAIVYTLDKALPAGVDSTTTSESRLRVSGTPSVKMERTAYKWTATDEDGTEESMTFHISVNGVPRFSATISDKSWTQRQAIDAFTLPTASGGDGSLSYSIDPALPSGVVKSASHEVTGTPTVSLASTEYTWTATDARRR